MASPPIVEIDPGDFWTDPYPALARMRREAPVCRVPQLGAILLTRRDDIFACEKNVAVFSSDQPQGLMTILMGQNMMRKDGEAHMNERRQAFPSVSPKTVRDHWKTQFDAYARIVLDEVAGREECDLVRDFAMPVSAHALRNITGLTNLSAAEMDSVSQAMIDGCANYAGDPAVEARCHTATSRIDSAIDDRLPGAAERQEYSLLTILSRAGQAMESIRANIKLAISGGQNEPRDAIAGTVWALLGHPDQLQAIRTGAATWHHAFEEYARWISPIGMSPRRVAQAYRWNDVDFEPESRVFLMFGSANRDETVFDDPETFDISRDTWKSVAFGAGPHFCAGAAASRTLIADVALPLIFERFPKMRLAGEAPFRGWAFRGPTRMPVRLH